MTDLEKKIIGLLDIKGYPTLNFCNVSVKDMTKNELELLCILLGDELLQRKPAVLKVSLL